MTGILQLERAKVNGLATSPNRDTWILELPPETCESEGFPVGTLVSLTIKDGGIQTSIIEPSAEIDDFVNKIVGEEGDFFEEIKQIGD
jgi:hypothetical protein